MKINQKTKLILALCTNIIIFILEIIGLCHAFIEQGNIGGIIFYYTEDSNIFLTITSGISIVYILLELIKGKEEPRIFKILKFSSVCTVMETFLVTVFILSFTIKSGNTTNHSMLYYLLFTGSMLYHHLLCPVISCLSFLLLEGKDNDKLTLKESFYAFIPTIIYGVIIIFLNIIKVVVGPYPFLHVYEQSVFMSILWGIIVLGCAFGITVVVGLLYNKINKRKEIK